MGRKIGFAAFLVALGVSLAGAYTRPGGQVAVGTGSPSIVCPAEPGRYSCSVANLDATDTLFCAESASVTTSNAGIVIFPRSGRTFDRDIKATPSSTVTRALYCISDGNGATAAWDGVVQ